MVKQINDPFTNAIQMVGKKNLSAGLGAFSLKRWDSQKVVA
jgi:hypothetical protein